MLQKGKLGSKAASFHLLLPEEDEGVWFVAQAPAWFLAQGRSSGNSFELFRWHAELKAEVEMNAKLRLLLSSKAVRMGNTASTWFRVRLLPWNQTLLRRQALKLGVLPRMHKS